MEACRKSGKVIPCFVFDDELLERTHNRSSRRVGFLTDCLKDLSRQVRSCGGQISFFRGGWTDVIGKLLSQNRVDAVFVNRDYTPFARRREDRLAAICARHGAELVICGDALLNEPETITKADGDPYKVFTPWFNAARQLRVVEPAPEAPSNLYTVQLGRPLSKVPGPVSGDTGCPGGRSAGLELLGRAGGLSNYGEDRDFPARRATSLLSAHLRFGTVSPREVYHHLTEKLGAGHPILRQLYWRDFYTHIAWHFPHVFKGAFRRQYDRIRWSADEHRFDAWCRGRTGFPLVDAGMRELVATGYMHNRVRMLTASLLVKNLHIDWRRGERFFARHLIDYDPSVNNGNWQWAASTGCDAQPYFRVFNPWRQQSRFDPEAVYIRRWVEELSDWRARDIHGLSGRVSGYIPPVVDLRESAAETKTRFKRASSDPE